MENPGSAKRRWQYTFLAGMVACIVSAFVVLDNAVFASTVTISTLAIGLVNSLLNPTDSSQDQGFVLSKLNLGLNVSRFLKTATILIWLLTIGVSGYGALQYYLESRKVTIEGYVIAANGEPAAGTFITFFLSGKKESATTADGKFIFTKVCG